MSTEDDKMLTTLKRAAAFLPDEWQRIDAVETLVEYVQSNPQGGVIARTGPWATDFQYRISRDLYNRIKEEMENREYPKKIQAIKLLRNETGIGLKKAKELMDGYADWKVD